MKLQITRGRLLATTMMAGVATFAAFAANAQDAAPTAAQADHPGRQRSRSRRRHRFAAAPHRHRDPVAGHRPDHRALKAQGITTIADAIRSLSADNSGSIPAAFGNGFAAGSTGVSLRGLSVNSTLVMIDGLRNANYPLADDGQKAFVDLNSIPFNAVERIETLKDGASSLYGADAIGGVVNIIMKSNYQGMSADASIGTSEHGGGDQYRFNADIGYGDLDTDKYNLYGDFEYQLDKRIRIDQRGFPYNTNDLTSIPGGQNNNPQAGGSTFYGNVKPAILTPGNLASGQAIGGVGNEWRPLRTCAADAPLTRTRARRRHRRLDRQLLRPEHRHLRRRPAQAGAHRHLRPLHDQAERQPGGLSQGSFVQSKTSVTGTPVGHLVQHAA
jgi:iron complex outermembrane receptor protein